MATLTLRSTDVGAPALVGSNGGLCTVLDWALSQNGWAIEYTATNKRVYRAGAGNRHRLFVGHDSTLSGAATQATIRGCENATAANEANLVDAFPTTALLANSSSIIQVSNSGGATRDYIIVLTPTCVIMAINMSNVTTSSWTMFAFGDASGVDSTDTWGTFIWTTGIITNIHASFPSTSAIGRVFWVRSIDGSIKSTQGHFHGPHNSGNSSGTPGLLSSAAAMRAGYGNRIVREKYGITCLGTQSTGTPGSLYVIKRGWLPSVWLPLHSGLGGVTSADTFQDLTTSATFQVVPFPSGILVLETSDTWSAPSG